MRLSYVFLELFMSRPFSRPLALAFVASTALLLAASGAEHMRLVKSFPEKDQVLNATPDHVQLWFSQEPEVALTRVRLMGPDDATMDLPKAQATEDPKSVTLAVPEALAEGTYTVYWQTAAPDGHKVKGEFAFRYEAQDSIPDSED